MHLKHNGISTPAHRAVAGCHFGQIGVDLKLNRAAVAASGKTLFVVGALHALFIIVVSEHLASPFVLKPGSSSLRIASQIASAPDMTPIWTPLPQSLLLAEFC